MVIEMDTKVAQDMIQGLSDLVKRLLSDSEKFRYRINDQYQEIQTLTQERDNALLRIEELENENADQKQVINQQRALIESLAANRGGVNPNA